MATPHNWKITIGDNALVYDNYIKFLGYVNRLNKTTHINALLCGVRMVQLLYHCCAILSTNVLVFY